MARYQNRLDNRLAQPKMNSPVRINQNGSQTSLGSLNRSIEAIKSPKESNVELRMMTQTKKRTDTIEKSPDREGINLRNQIANCSSMIDLSNNVASQIQKPVRNMRNSIHATQSFAGGNSIENLDQTAAKTSKSILAHDDSLVQIEMQGSTTN